MYKVEIFSMSSVLCPVKGSGHARGKHESSDLLAFLALLFARHLHVNVFRSCITATDDLLSSFESPPNSNGLKNHDSIMPPSYEAAKQIPVAGM